MEKALRSGFTTGTCAAAAAKAAAFLLCTGKPLYQVHMVTPGGRETDLKIEEFQSGKNYASCKVRKDSGDDPDVTNGSLIGVCIWRLKDGEKTEDGSREVWKDGSRWYEDEEFPGVYLTGGTGIGLVTKPGLSCPVGKHAINPVPRKMILSEVFQMKEAWGEKDGLLAVVEIPQGEELAKKTFNSKLGILGGLSILGTTGIVEPMSEEALMASIALEIHMKAVEGRDYLILTPGNYGQAFLQERMNISLEEGVKCSNFIADAVRCGAKEGFGRGLMAGHAGKLVKAAAGVENTHSKYGDRRMEILADLIREYGRTAKEEIKNEEEELISRILASNTTKEAIDHLEAAGIHRQVGNLAAEKLRKQILTWTNGTLSMDVILFSGENRIWGESRRTINVREDGIEKTE